MRLLFSKAFSIISESLKFTVMKKFKLIDCWMSTILITGSFVYGFTSRDFSFIRGYFVVGVWQLISIITHYLTNTFIGRSRNNYTKIIAWIAISLLIIAVISQAWEEFYGLMMFELFLLLIVAPIMAIYYTRLCFEETYVKMKRPLALLK